MRPIYSLSVFLLYKDVYFEYTHCYKKTIINKLLDFLFKFCCRAIKFTKGNSYYFKETSDTKRFLLTFNKNNPHIPDASTLKITINHQKKKKKKKKKKKEMVTRSKIVTQQPKTIGNLKIINIKPVFIEHPKTSC